MLTKVAKNVARVTHTHTHTQEETRNSLGLVSVPKNKIIYKASYVVLAT